MTRYSPRAAPRRDAGILLLDAVLGKSFPRGQDLSWNFDKLWASYRHGCGWGPADERSRGLEDRPRRAAEAEPRPTARLPGDPRAHRWAHLRARCTVPEIAAPP